MESIYTELALYGSKNECARTDTVFAPISEVCHGTVSLKSFLCLLSLILHYYAIHKVECVPFYSKCLFCIWVLLYIVATCVNIFFATSLLLYGCLSQFIDVLVIATTLTLENRNYFLLIHNLSPNHD